MKTKPKLIICFSIFVSCGIANVFFSTALHNILSGQMKTLEFIGAWECINSITANRQHMLLYLCLQGFALILSIAFFLTNTRPYQSHLNLITPDIHTPAAVGQYQHGSAKWLTDKEKDSVFECFVLNPNDTRIRELLRSGYDGLDFMEGA